MVKRLKKPIAAVLTVVMLFASICTAHASGSYFAKDGFYFGVKDGEAYIHGTDSTGWDIVIPETFLSYYVTEIEEFAFYENQSIEVLSFYEASQLNRLGNGAFSHCRKLKKVHITESIQEMGVGVFEDCTALSYVRFRDGALTEVAAQSFYGCTALTNVVFDNELTSIGNLAFANCTALTRVDIPDSVVSISDNAFSGCDDLILGCAYNTYTLDYAKNNNIDYYVRDAVLGDFNCDGEVNILDATCIQKYEVGLYDISYTGKYTGDVNGDNKISVRDATLIQMYIARLDNRYGIGTSRKVYSD